MLTLFKVEHTLPVDFIYEAKATPSGTFTYAQQKYICPAYDLDNIFSK